MEPVDGGRGLEAVGVAGGRFVEAAAPPVPRGRQVGEEASGRRVGQVGEDGERRACVAMVVARLGACVVMVGGRLAVAVQYACCVFARMGSLTTAISKLSARSAAMRAGESAPPLRWVQHARFTTPGLGS